MSWTEQFPGHFAWATAALVTKAMPPYGAVALWEIDQACEKLKSRQAEPDAWREEWCALGARVEAHGIRELALGHRLSAGNFLLPAGRSAFTGERFMTPGPEKRRVGAKALRLQQEGLLIRYPNMERV